MLADELAVPEERGPEVERALRLGLSTLLEKIVEAQRPEVLKVTQDRPSFPEVWDIVSNENRPNEVLHGTLDNC